ncbi:MAG: phosphodiester glycosidase family protein, partial [Acidimicrobiia bacterium]
QDRITHNDDGRELPSAMCARVNCMVAINGDFWDYQNTKQALGGAVSGGRMLRSPQPGHPQVTLTGDGRLIAGDLLWTAFVRADDGTSVKLTAINRAVSETALADNEIALFTPEWGGPAPAGAGAELVLEAAEPLGALDHSVTLEAVGLRPAGGPIPANGVVLRGTGTGDEAVRRLWTSVETGDNQNRHPLTLSLSSPTDAVESLGSHPVLLRDGQKAFDQTASDSFTTGTHPRTMLGWSTAGDIFMVTVDDQGNGSDSVGMSLNDATNLLLGLGATDAVGLDGGGGTTFVVDGEVMNQPEDGEERESVSAFVVVRDTAGGGGPNPTPGAPPGGGGPSDPPPFQPGVPARSGYWMVAADGAVYTFGDAPWMGNAPLSGGDLAVDLEPTPSGGGYWIVDDAGHVFTFGDATHMGNVESFRLMPGEKVTSLSATPSGHGYWIFTSKGRVITKGAAQHFGDVAGIRLNGPVLDSIPTPTGLGYYMVASDGGIFTFGDAVFYGSTGAIRLNAPVQSLVPDPDGVGYWLVASDGGVFSFEGAFRGSLGGQQLNRPVTGMVPYGNGYLMVGEDGGVFNFSDQAFSGSLGASPPARPVVSVAALD